MTRTLQIALAVVLLAIALVVTHFVVTPGNVGLLDWYEPVDDHTIRIGTTTGDFTWTRVTAVVESPAEVRVTVTSTGWPLVTTGDVGRDFEVLVSLEQPLGDRRVFDPFHEVPRR